MRKIISLVCVLALLCAPASLAQGETFIYQEQASFVYAFPDGHIEGGVLYLVKNNIETPLFFAAFSAPVLDEYGNTLTTAYMDSRAPTVIMPGEFSFVWCIFQSDEISPDKVKSVAAPQAECYGFPESTDASEDLSISEEKCEIATLENGEKTARLSATVTNTSDEERSGSGGYFMIVGAGDDPTFFPIAFRDDALLGKLEPGESVTVGVELPELFLYILGSLGYEQIDADELPFTARAFATKLK